MPRCIDNATLADEMEKVSKIPLYAQPGTVWGYGLSPDLQARLVEVISGERFGDFLQERIFKPLGMHDTAFAFRLDMAHRMAQVYWSKHGALSRWGAANLPPMFPGFAWPDALARLTDISVTFERGAFGLYSTLDDYLRFLQMLAHGGSLGDVRIISPETVALITTDHLGGIPMPWDVKGLGFGYGFAVIKDPAATGAAGTAGTFYWHGAAGTLFWVDPERDLIVVALTQHLMTPAAEPHALAAELHNLIYHALLT
jgi:CubicO group peptidase (beta-lactamase class C family)